MIQFVALANARAQDLFSLDRLLVRQSLDTKQVAEPAFFNFVAPSGKSTWLSIGLGIKYDASPASNWELGPFIEYAKSTEIEKEQSIFKAGVSYDWTILDLAENISSPLLIGKTNYNRDGIKETDGLQFSASFTILFRGKGKKPDYFYIPNIVSNLGAFDFLYSPHLGFEYEDIMRAKGNSTSATISRILGKVQISIYPFSESLENKFEILSDFTFRHDIVNQTPSTDKDHPILKLNLNYYLLKDAKAKKSIGVGIAYINGEDPAAGFDQQQLVKLSLIFQWNPK